MDEVQPSMEDRVQVGIGPSQALSVDPLAHQRFRAKRCDNHVPPIGYARNCGLYKYTLVGGAEISGFLGLLMTLPTEIRDRIYDFLVFGDVPEVVHAAWLSPLQLLVIPLRSAYPGRQHAMPSLENKGQGWNTGTTKPSEMEICHVQGVVLNLHKLANGGCSSAVKVRNDVLGFLGRTIVLELQFVAYESFYQPPECNWSTLCGVAGPRSSLWAYYATTTHISIEYCHPKGIAMTNSLQPADWTKEFVTTCARVKMIMPKIKSVIFWIQLTEAQISSVLEGPDNSQWFQACESIAVKGVDIEVKLRVVRETKKDIEWTNHGDPELWIESFSSYQDAFLARSIVWSDPMDGGKEDEHHAAVLKALMIPDTQ